MKFQVLNKSALTNAGCLVLASIGWYFSDTAIGNLIMIGGIFGFSGALTNWFAVYMLFEKIPFLYGSGIIVLRFESFKKHLLELSMGTFFTQENLQRHLPEILSKMQSEPNINSIAKKIDADKLFDELIIIIEESSLGGLLSLFGGKQALEGFRETFCQKVTEKAPDVIRSVMKDLGEWQKKQIKSETVQEMIKHVIVKKLDELTPKTVKEIVEKIIREHLGWLVFWGGVFGFIIGCVSVLLGII